MAACTEAGLQAGFHAIGDAAVTSVVDGVRAAAEKVGLARVRAARHRVEHAEMLTPETIAAFAELGLTASVQPAFDAPWGGEDGMYASGSAPSGPARSTRSRPCCGPGCRWPSAPTAPSRRSTRGAPSGPPPSTAPPSTGSPCAPRSPRIRGAAGGRSDATTRASWCPARPADYAVWRTEELVVQAPDDRVARWSTDPRSGTPGLPDLTPGAPLPVCLRTVVGGRTVFVRPDE